MKQKELIEKLDMTYFSKQLFVFNYKLVRKQKRYCLKKIKQLKNEPLLDTDYYLQTNLENFQTVLRLLNHTISYGNQILENGVDRGLLCRFYHSFINVFVREWE